MEAKAVLPVTQSLEKAEEENEENEEIPFTLPNLHLTIPQGSFVAIIGSVGSGKVSFLSPLYSNYNNESHSQSSLLQALIGEMRLTDGTISFGGRIAYVSQIPWIRNTSVRGNVIFGGEEDSDRLEEVINACSLGRDIDLLPHGLETEIGEKGVNLSGGQKVFFLAYSSF